MLSDDEKNRLDELKGKTDLSPEEQAELAALVQKESGDDSADEAPPAKEKASKAKAPAFSKKGATSVITMRDGKPLRVWFKDGKEIGVEDAG